MTFADYLTTHGLDVSGLASMAHVDEGELFWLAYKHDKYTDKRWADAPLWLAASVADVLGLNAQDLLDFDR